MHRNAQRLGVIVFGVTTFCSRSFVPSIVPAVVSYCSWAHSSWECHTWATGKKKNFFWLFLLFCESLKTPGPARRKLRFVCFPDRFPPLCFSKSVFCILPVLSLVVMSRSTSPFSLLFFIHANRFPSPSSFILFVFCFSSLPSLPL